MMQLTRTPFKYIGLFPIPTFILARLADLLLHLIVPVIALLAFYARRYLPMIIALTP